MRLNKYLAIFLGTIAVTILAFIAYVDFRLFKAILESIWEVGLTIFKVSAAALHLILLLEFLFSEVSSRSIRNVLIVDIILVLSFFVRVVYVGMI